MKTKHIALTVVLAITALGATSPSQPPHSSKPAAKLIVPRMWDDNEMPTLEVPLANPAGSPKPVSADYYYKIPVRPVYKQYPVYAPGREPAGYMDWLKLQEPIILWDSATHKPKLDTAADFIKAGELILDAPIIYSTENKGGFAMEDVRNPAWYVKNNMPLTSERHPPFHSLRHPRKG